MKTRFMGILQAMSLVAAISAIGFLVSCGVNDKADNNGSGSAALSLFMIDSPVSDADAINITVDAVSVNGPNGWIDLTVTPKRYNLLKLMNNVGVTLADQVMPQGEYGEIRLILECGGDQAPEIVIAGESFPLKVPSGCTSGFKLKGAFTLAPGHKTVLVMDFDMQKSIHETGNGKYMLNPVVRFIQVNAAGNIIARATPIVPRTTFFAFAPGAFTGDNFDAAIDSTIIDGTGALTLAALTPGTYDIVAAVAGYKTAVYVKNVVVEAGKDSTLANSIELTPGT